MNQKPNSDRSTRAQRRRDEREKAETPVQPQGLPAKEVFAQLGEATFFNNQLVEANNELRRKVEAFEAANAELQKLVEKLTPKPEPEPSVSEAPSPETPKREEAEVPEEQNSLQQQEPSDEDLAMEELLARAKQEAEED